MTLAVVVRPHNQGHRARRIKSNLRPFGWAAGRLFDAVGDSDPAQFAGAFGIRPAIRELSVVYHLQRGVHVLLKLAGVVCEQEPCTVGLADFGDQITAPDLGGIYPHFTCSGIDHAFDTVNGFGPPRATIGAGGIGVGEHAGDVGIDCLGFYMCSTASPDC